jgi:hypothetical protein
MSDDKEDDHDRQLRNLEQASDVVKHRIERVDPIFSHAINTLWAGNGTACLAVLGAISATSKNGVIDKRTLVPLFLFMSGLICMCIGSLVTLFGESAAINRMQAVSNMLDFQGQDVQSPIEWSGLTFRNWRTLMALFAGGFFIAGCLAGFLILLIA